MYKSKLDIKCSINVLNLSFIDWKISDAFDMIN